MRFLILSIFILFTLTFSFSFEIGGALSIDYYNNPIIVSAPSPIQNRPILFHSFTKGLFNIRSGFGVTEGFYDVVTDIIPVFNDYYPGFYTLEFDLFSYPGLQINITDNFAIGLAVGGGVRLPLLTSYEDTLTEEYVNGYFSWFYKELHFLFWGAQLYSTIKLPLSSDTRFFISINYKSFISRESQWLIGATSGLLWHIN